MEEEAVHTQDTNSWLSRRELPKFLHKNILFEYKNVLSMPGHL